MMEPPANGVTFTMNDGQHMIAFYPWCDDVSGPAIGIIYPTAKGMMAKVDYLEPPTIIAMMQCMLLMLNQTAMPGPDPEPEPPSPKHKFKVV